MFIITDYTLDYKEDLGCFWVIPGSDVPVCPYCGGRLVYRDRRARIFKHEGGSSDTLMIRRLRCCNCRRYHNELPDCLVPHKHYGAEVISGVIDGVVTQDDEDSEDYPCMETMLRWLRWFTANIINIEGALRRAGHVILSLGEEILSMADSLLEAIRGRYPDWLERTVRIVVNSGGSLPSVR